MKSKTIKKQSSRPIWLVLNRLEDELHRVELSLDQIRKKTKNQVELSELTIHCTGLKTGIAILSEVIHGVSNKYRMIDS